MYISSCTIIISKNVTKPVKGNRQVSTIDDETIDVKENHAEWELSWCRIDYVFSPGDVRAS